MRFIYFMYRVVYIKHLYISNNKTEQIILKKNGIHTHTMTGQFFLNKMIKYKRKITLRINNSCCIFNAVLCHFDFSFVKTFTFSRLKKHRNQIRNHLLIVFLCHLTYTKTFRSRQLF